MTDASLLRAVRHNGWANDKLIEACRDLTGEQLGLTVPGTFGSIHATLGHIVGAEHGYLFRLTQELPRGGPIAPGQLVPLDELRARARSNAERMEQVLASDFDPLRIVTRPGSTTRATAAIVVAQFIHHGSDHRAHIGTILGAHGKGLPEWDLWAYGTSIGEVTDKA